MTYPNHGVRSRLRGADTVVLCVHGIQGSPCQFDWLVESIPEHTDYLCILLPGHGGTAKEFGAVGWRDWLEYVAGVCRELPKGRRGVFSLAALSGVLCFFF